MVTLEYDKHERKKTIDSLLKIGVPMQEINKAYQATRRQYAHLKAYDPEKPNRKAIYREIARVMTDVYSNIKSGTYKLEVLNNIPKGLNDEFKEQNPLTARAKYINSIYSQTGAGIYRYVFNPSTKEMKGIAYHPKGNNTYKWVVKF